MTDDSEDKPDDLPNDLDFILLADNSSMHFCRKLKKILRTKKPSFKFEVKPVVNRRHDDGEKYIQVPSVREQEIFLVNLVQHPHRISMKRERFTRQQLAELLHKSESPASSLYSLFLMEDALVRGDVERFSVIMPYWPDMRSDKKDEPGTSINSRVSAKLMQAAGEGKLRRFITCDMHASQLQGFFDCPADNLYCVPMFEWYIKNRLFPEFQNQNGIRGGNLRDEFIVVAFDAGGVRANRKLARNLGLDFVLVEKDRPKHTTEGGESQVSGIYGEAVKDKIILSWDDIFGSGGTFEKAWLELSKLGAKSLYFFTTHYVANPKYHEGRISKWAEERIHPKTRIFTTDTLYHADAYLERWGITELSVAPLIAEALHRIKTGRSVSEVFNNPGIMEKEFNRWYSYKEFCKEYSPSR